MCSCLLGQLLPVLHALTAPLVLCAIQILAKAEPTALAASAEVVKGKLVTASAIAQSKVRVLRYYEHVCQHSGHQLASYTLGACW